MRDSNPMATIGALFGLAVLACMLYVAVTSGGGGSEVSVETYIEQRAARW